MDVLTLAAIGLSVIITGVSINQYLAFLVDTAALKAEDDEDFARRCSEVRP